MSKSTHGVPGLTPPDGFLGKPSTSHLTDGGVRMEMSDCCNAKVTETKGGVIWKVCSKCGRRIEERRFG